MRFRARPESNITDYYVDTGSFPAKHANELALESLYNRGPFSVLTECTKAWVASPKFENPGFSGTYIVGSYVLTGEKRPYDKLLGYARRIIPKSRWGAVEFVGRFGYLDIDDTLVKGGKLKNGTPVSIGGRRGNGNSPPATASRILIDLIRLDAPNR